MTRASIIIVYYNRYQLLLDTLNSLKPTLSDQDEVLLVNNDSPEGHQEDLPRDYPWVKVINSDKNLGISGGNNLGVSQASGKYLVFINPDTILTEGWLDALITRLESSPKIGMVTSRLVLRRKPQTMNAAGNDMHVSGLTMCRGMGDPLTNHDESESVTAVSGASFVISAEFYKHIGGFDDNIFLYMEDSDLSLRCRLAGKSIVYEPASLVYHDYELTFGPNKTFLQESHRYYMLGKNYRRATLLFMLPILFTAELVTWGYMLLRDRKHLGNKAKAYRWLREHRPLINSMYRQTQPIRQVTDRQLILGNTHRLDYGQTGAGLVTSVALVVFDTLFLILKYLSLVFIWW